MIKETIAMNYPKDMAKQVIQFYKTTFDNSFGTLVMLQDQAEKLLKTFVEQTPGMNDEGRKVLDQWTSVYKKGRDDFKKAMDEGYAKVEDFFDRFKQS
jgi:polyhydroxyalkanoate synthesis regulator phasin